MKSIINWFKEDLADAIFFTVVGIVLFALSVTAILNVITFVYFITK